LDAEFIRDLFAPFRPVAIRRMFSGAGIYADGTIFALMLRGALYLKVDDTNRADFEREGCGPFTYTRGKGKAAKQHTLPYWRLPERLYDDPDELAAWAEKALAVSERSKLSGRTTKPRRSNVRRHRRA
jgi:DNA transformation protein and related proteins